MLCSSDACATVQMAEGRRALSLQMALLVSLAPAMLGVVVMTVLVDGLRWGECFWDESWTVCVGKGPARL